MTPKERLDAQRRAQLRKDRQLQQQLAAAYREAWQRIRQDLDKLLAQIRDQQQAGKPVPVDWLFREQRVQRFEQQALANITLFTSYAHRKITTAALVALRNGQMDARTLLRSTLPPGYPLNAALPVAQLEQFVRNTMPGTPLQALLGNLGAQAALQARTRLIEGVALGRNPVDVAREMRAAFNGNAARALLVARTEMIRSYRQAALTEYRQSRVVNGWIWVATLDKRTCPVCVALNGTFHSLDETFGSHPACRCSPAPATRSWSELGFPGLPETSLQLRSGEDWFAAQPADTQRQMLGPGKYRLYADGLITLKDLVEPTVSPLWGPGVKERALRDLTAARV